MRKCSRERSTEGYLTQGIEGDPVGHTLMDSLPLFTSRHFDRTPVSPLWTRPSSDANVPLRGVGGTGAVLPGEGGELTRTKQPRLLGQLGQAQRHKAPPAAKQGRASRDRGGEGGEKFPPQPNPPQGLTPGGGSRPRRGRGKAPSAIGWAG